MLDTGSCLLLSNILVYGYTPNILPVHLLMDVCIVSSFWLLWMRPLLSSLHNLCVKYALFLLGKYVGTEMLGHMVSVGLYVNLLKKLSNCFLKCLYRYQDFSFFFFLISHSFDFQQLTGICLDVAFFVYTLLNVVEILDFIR